MPTTTNPKTFYLNVVYPRLMLVVVLSFYLLSFHFAAHLYHIMSGASGSADTWVDPTGLDNPVWVAPASVSDRLPSDPSADVWMDPTVSFDQDGSYWDGDEWLGEAPGDPKLSKEYASRDLAELFLEKYHSGKWPATDICKIAYLVTEGGMIGPATAFAKRPGLHSSKYNGHLKKLVGLTGSEETLAHLTVPPSDSVDGSRIEYKLAVIHPYELLNREMAEDGEELTARLAELVREDKLPPVYLDHPVSRAAGNKAQPWGLYLDGVPTTKKEGVLGGWCYFLLS